VALLSLVLLLGICGSLLAALPVRFTTLASLGEPTSFIQSVAGLFHVDPAASRFRSAAPDHWPPRGRERPRWKLCTRLSPA
jgi:hypothetical protein